MSWTTSKQLIWREKNHNKRYNKWLHVTCNYYTRGKQMKKRPIYSTKARNVKHGEQNRINLFQGQYFIKL